MKISKSSSRGRVIFIILIFLVIAILSNFFYRIGYLPIVGTQIAEKELSKYATNVLEIVEPVDCTYDWYSGRYIVKNDIGRSLSYRLRGNTVVDEALIEQINGQAASDYNSILKNLSSNLDMPQGITVWTEISSDDYSKKAQRLYLLGVRNEEELSEEDSFKRPSKITMEILNQFGSNYNFTGIQMSYGDKNGMYEILIPADTFEPLSEEKLTTHTTKISNDNLPEDYLLWLEEKGFDKDNA